MNGSALLLRIALLALPLLLTLPANGQVRGISYTISPTLEKVYWNDNAGLDGNVLYGGQLGFGFGEYVELTGLYLVGNEFETDFSGFDGLSSEFLDILQGLGTKDVDVRRYGAELKVNVPQGSVVPFVTAGTGILQFDPDDLESSSRIYLTGGAGVQFSAAGRYTMSIQLQNLNYRYNVGSTFFTEEDLEGTGLTASNFNQSDVSNWALKGSLQFYLGGRARGERSELDEAFLAQFEDGLRGISLPIEPFGGKVDFSDDLGYTRNQRVAGLYTGLDFGPYVGVRAFYWRGLQEDTFSETADIQSFGGELRLRLSSGYRSLEPFVSLGGGYLDVLEGYEARPGRAPGDQPYALAGLGATLPLNETLRFRGGVRALLISNESTDDISEPADVQTSYQYSAGLSFVLGGERGSAATAVEERIQSAESEARTGQAELARRLDATQARLDSLLMLLDAAPQDTVARLVRPVAADSMGAITQRTAEPAAERPTQFVTLPIPEEGELYVRFGPPGGTGLGTYDPATGTYYADDGYLYDEAYRVDTTASVPRTTYPPVASPDALTAEQIREIVRATLQEELRRVSAAEATESDVERLEARIADRLGDLERRLERRLDDQRATQPQTPVVIQPSETPRRNVVVDDQGDVVDLEREGGIFGQRFSGLQVNSGLLSSPLGGEQFVLGVRGDFRPLEPSAFRYQPELAIGFGGGETSYLLGLNALLPFDFGVLPYVDPYVGLGGALISYTSLSDLEGALNLIGGVERTFGFGMAYAEYTAVDFFDAHRVIVGYRVTF